MSRLSEADRVSKLLKKIKSGTKLYEKWSKRFDTDLGEKYYLGEQWRGLSDAEADKRYTINMVFASIETNKPTLVFYRPQIKVQPRPGRASRLGSDSEARAKLCEDAIQTFIDDPDIDFQGETELALQEAHFRFGVIEVGYTADWVDNPNAGKPIQKDDTDDEPMTDSDNKTIDEPAKITDHEKLYVKHVPANTFRVSISSKNRLANNDWVGYFEWHYVEDLKSNSEYTTSGLKPTGVVTKELDGDDGEEPNDREGMVKVWKIWSLRSGKRSVVADGYNKFLLEDKPYEFLPFAVLKFHEILNEFYPMPPVYNWLNPQDEVNEVREAQKAHRARMYRRYTYKDGSIDAEEIEKLETGGIGVYAKANQDDPIKPIQDAPMGADVWRHLDESKHDFLEVSGVSGEQRGVAEADTATQASLIDQRSRLREASARTRVADWLAQIARLILLAAREYMTLPFWIKQQVDPFVAASAPEVVQAIAERWKEINAEDIENIDLDISVELASMSPVTEDIQRNAWNAVLQLLTNPQIVMMFAASEAILRKTLSLYGIKNENEIKEVQRVCQLAVQQAQQAQAAEAAAKGMPPASTPSNPSAPANGTTAVPADNGNVSLVAPGA